MHILIKNVSNDLNNFIKNPIQPQAQHDVFSYSSPEAFVTLKLVNSSAAVGCIPTVLSKSYLVNPTFNATA